MIKHHEPNKQTHRLITHLHSQASDGPASPLYPYVRDGICRLVGEERADDLYWKEALISFHMLEKFASGHESDIDVMCITDHMSKRAHVLHPSNLRLAETYSSVIVGAEISCVVKGEDGSWLRAPEIIVYGPPQLRQTENRQHYGLVQQDLEFLYDACAPDEAPEALFELVLEFVESHGYAYAVPHPMDGNDLTFEQLQKLLVNARAVEVLNGGFPDSTYPYLAKWVAFHNTACKNSKQVREHCQGKAQALAYLDLLESANGKPQIALAGSDAHLRNLDRVVTVVQYRSHEPYDPAQRFLQLLQQGQPQAAYIRHEGHGSSWLSLYSEALRIVAYNLWHNKSMLKGNMTHGFSVAFEIVQERLQTYEGRSNKRNTDLAAFVNSLPSVQDDCYTIALPIPEPEATKSKTPRWIKKATAPLRAFSAGAKL